MAKFKIYEVNETEELCNLGKALASPIRLAMLQLLYEQGMNIGEMAKELDIPASSASFHLNLLEQAGLIRMEKQPGTRGSVKLCNRKVDYVTINLIQKIMILIRFTPQNFRWARSAVVAYHQPADCMGWRGILVMKIMSHVFIIRSA